MSGDGLRHYSGSQSKWFWNRVKRLRTHRMQGEIYSLGCALQELEHRALAALEEGERQRKLTKKARKP